MWCKVERLTTLINSPLCLQDFILCLHLLCGVLQGFELRAQTCVALLLTFVLGKSGANLNAEPTKKDEPRHRQSE